MDIVKYLSAHKVNTKFDLNATISVQRLPGTNEDQGLCKARDIPGLSTCHDFAPIRMTGETPFDFIDIAFRGQAMKGAPPEGECQGKDPFGGAYTRAGAAYVTAPWLKSRCNVGAAKARGKY